MRIIIPETSFRIEHGCRIPEKRIACFKCEDFEHEYVEIKYQLYIIVEDEEKEQILMSINDTVCLFRDFFWSDLRFLRTIFGMISSV